MPQNDDQMKRRREKRAAMDKRRKAEARRLRRTVIIAILVLAACGWGIWKLAGSAPSQEEAEKLLAAMETTVETTEETRPTEPSPITTIHVKMAGDLNITDSVVNAGVAVSGYDFNPVFRDVAAILADADLTLLNFEGNVCGGEYGTQTTSAPVELLHALRGCGVDMLQMANSCSVNNGLNGLTATLNNIRNAGMEPIGAYASEEEYQKSKGYTIVDAQGIKIALVAFTKGLGGRGMPVGNENLVNILYEDYSDSYTKINETKINTILKAVEAETPDIVIALLHWGSEYNEDISSSQKKIVSLMQKGGVDVILGTHPHVLHPIDYDAQKGTLVAYSLGDFFGDAKRGATNYSIILDLEITKDSLSKTTKVTGYTYDPIYTVTENESIGTDDRRVVRISKAIEASRGNFLDRINDTCQESMTYAMQRIGERLRMPGEETEK